MKAGTYSLFLIPNEKEWTVILNTDLDYWGAFKYNPEHDVLRVPASVHSLAEPLENFSIQFEATTDKQGVLRFGWDKTYGQLGFEYN